ncbi:MAG: hypothetical protein C7B44_08875 [Sulfobacillus thermosulfidooxidans]|nr:MAG: hypothetical protein C7B44_08875 [Sulfobacillus thermosulfidooxidans]
MKTRTFWVVSVPGIGALLWALIRMAPPVLALAHGHPDRQYYSYSFSHGTYSDVAALYSSRHLYARALPYFHNIIEYPVIIGFYMWAMAWLPGFWGYWVGSGIGLVLAFVGALYALWHSRGWRAALWFSASPLLLVCGLLNWDLLGIMTWGWALWEWKAQRWALTGVALGVGMATKFFPVVLVPYLFWGLRQRHQRGEARRLLWGFVLTAGGLNLPCALWARPGWAEFFTFNSGRGPAPGLYQWLILRGVLHIDTVNLLSLVLTVGGGVALLWAQAQGRLDPIEAGTAALAWWLLCNKVYSPQYMLWVVYALLWVDSSPPLLVAVNVAGLLDFLLAMRWLALGTLGSPVAARFGRAVVPVIAWRDVVLWSAVYERWHLSERRHVSHKVPTEGAV